MLVHFYHFQQCLTGNRFSAKLKFLYFADNSCNDVNDTTRNKIYRAREVVQLLVDQFKSVYIPTQRFSINEELLLWKCRLSFKQYVPSKVAKSEIKLFSLCEDSGYLWNSYLLLGKNPGTKLFLDLENHKFQNNVG